MLLRPGGVYSRGGGAYNLIVRFNQCVKNITWVSTRAEELVFG